MNKTIQEISNQLDVMKKAGKFKTLPVIEGPMGPTVKLVGGREVVNLCSNNYLGLANHPEVVEGAHKQAPAFDEESKRMAILSKRRRRMLLSISIGMIPAVIGLLSLVYGCAPVLKISSLSAKEKAVLSRRLDASHASADLGIPSDLSPETPSVVEVELENIQGYIFVPVEIPGAGTRRFCLDTGTWPSALFYPVASVLDTRLFPGPKTVLSELGREDTWSTVIPSMRLGKAELHNVSCLVAKKRLRLTLWRFIKLAELQGIFGLNALRTFNVSFDFPASKMSLYRRGNEQFSSIEKSAFCQVPLIDWPGSKDIIVSAYIGDKGPFKFMVDTGATGGGLIFRYRSWKSLGLDKRPDKDEVFLDNLKIGNFTIEKVPAKSLGEKDERCDDYDGLLAMDLFCDYRVSFDFDKGIMYLGKSQTKQADAP